MAIQKIAIEFNGRKIIGGYDDTDIKTVRTADGEILASLVLFKSDIKDYPENGDQFLKYYGTYFNCILDIITLVPGQGAACGKDINNNLSCLMDIWASLDENKLREFYSN